ncbi:asparagine synthase-related protein [Streptomyces sp. P9-A4]
MGRDAAQVDPRDDRQRRRGPDDERRRHRRLPLRRPRLRDRHGRGRGVRETPRAPPAGPDLRGRLPRQPRPARRPGGRGVPRHRTPRGGDDPRGRRGRAAESRAGDRSLRRASGAQRCTEPAARRVRLPARKGRSHRRGRADELFVGYPDCHREPYLAADALQARLVETVEGLHWENLQRCDRTTMAYGLEARVPFLDRDVIELALSIPPEHKRIGLGIEEKKLLRDAFTGWLPEGILRCGKLQFGHGSGAKDVLTAALTPAGTARTVDLDAEEEAAFSALWSAEFPGIEPEPALGRSALGVERDSGSPERPQTAFPHV